MSGSIPLLALLYLAGQALTHEHHTDEIPEGEAISAQPIVLISPPHRPPQPVLTFEHQDTTLWIHIAIQITSFGVIFPTGMVLGVCRLLLWPCPDLCKSDCFSDHPFTMARTSPSPRRPPFNRRLLPWPCPWWSPIRPQCTLFLRTLPHAHAHRASRTWCLPKAAS